jgi:hypothetical protein
MTAARHACSDGSQHDTAPCLHVLSSHDEARTFAATIFDGSLPHPVTLMLSFPCYAFSLLIRAI